MTHRLHSYTLAALLDLRVRLAEELRTRSNLIGDATVETHGSIAAGSTSPRDLDVLVVIARSLDDAPVRQAIEDAITATLSANCFDRSTALLVEKAGIWQWPLDAQVTDSHRRLYLKAIGFRPRGQIEFALLDAPRTQL